jgi:beta-lactam-binding protein with PASTA domain
MSLERIAMVVTLVTASCAVPQQLGLNLGGSGGSSGNNRSVQMTMIDVTGMTPTEAEAALRAAGVRGSIDVKDNISCDNPKVEELHVCYTAPAAGQATSSTIPVTLNLRYKETKSFDMPDFVGKTVDEARRTLIAMGQSPERFIVEEMVGAPADCEPNRICKQSPEAGRKHWVSLAAWLWYGPANRPQRPRPPTDATKPTDTTKPNTTKPTDTAKPIF